MRDVWKVLLVGVLCYLSTEVGLAHKHYVEGQISNALWARKIRGV